MIWRRWGIRAVKHRATGRWSDKLWKTSVPCAWIVYRLCLTRYQVGFQFGHLLLEIWKYMKKGGKGGSKVIVNWWTMDFVMIRQSFKKQRSQEENVVWHRLRAPSLVNAPPLAPWSRMDRQDYTKPINHTREKDKKIFAPQRSIQSNLVQDVADSSTYDESVSSLLKITPQKSSQTMNSPPSSPDSTTYWTVGIHQSIAQDFRSGTHGENEEKWLLLLMYTMCFY